MPDFCSDALWTKDGCGISDEELPISDALRRRLRNWQKLYDSKADSEGMKEPEFSNEGRRIARAIKAELPDWTVIYFDNYRCNITLNAELKLARRCFEYEIK